MRRLSLFVALFFVPALASAQFVTEYDRVLVPLGMFETPGAHGSLWNTALFGFNQSDRFYAVKSEPDLFCVIPEGCPGVPAQPRKTFSTFVDAQRGAFLYIDRGGVEHIRFSLRVYEGSATANSPGTQIPVVRESQFSTEPLQLLNIPTMQQGVRVALRVYDFDGRAGDVRMRVYAFAGQQSPDSEPAYETVLHLQPSPKTTSAITPGYAAITDLLPLIPPQRFVLQHIRIELTPVTEGLRIWGFASITNNQSQHVTVIAPDTAHQ